MNIGEVGTKVLFEDAMAIHIACLEKLQTVLNRKRVQKNCCIKDQQSKNNSISICH